MKASDKICVAPHQIFDYDLDIQEVGHNEAEEYIRKEALLEWANEQIKVAKANNLAYSPFEKLIDKLNEM